MNEHSIRLPRAGMEIDLGGIGKEYAADRMATLCLEHGLEHALVNLGGDVRVAGAQQDGAPWRVGIRHPRRDAEVIATVEMTSGGLATSGDYEHFSRLTVSDTAMFSTCAAAGRSVIGNRSASPLPFA